MDIKGAHVLVTGGSLGIGKATAQCLVEEGATVVITGRNANRLESAAREIGAKSVVFDISDLESIPEKATSCLERLDGHIDVLVNNAGIGTFSPLGEVTAQQFDDVFRTNVFGLALLTQEIIRPMKEKKSGTILNIGSTASLKGFARGTVYSASKFALRSMSQSWQAELRPYNIRVCQVNPSEVTTAFNNSERKERAPEPNKLDSTTIAHAIINAITMENKGFIPEVTIWATNPF